MSSLPKSARQLRLAWQHAREQCNRCLCVLVCCVLGVSIGQFLRSSSSSRAMTLVRSPRGSFGARLSTRVSESSAPGTVALASCTMHGATPRSPARRACAHVPRALRRAGATDAPPPSHRRTLCGRHAVPSDGAALLTSSSRAERRRATKVKKPNFRATRVSALLAPREG